MYQFRNKEDFGEYYRLSERMFHGYMPWSSGAMAGKNDMVTKAACFIYGSMIAYSAATVLLRQF